MNIKVRKIGNEYGVILPKQMLESLALQEGSVLDVETTGNVIQMTPADEQFTRQVEAFLKSEPFHRNTCRELAK